MGSRLLLRLHVLQGFFVIVKLPLFEKDVISARVRRHRELLDMLFVVLHLNPNDELVILKDEFFLADLSEMIAVRNRTRVSHMSVAIEHFQICHDLVLKLEPENDGQERLGHAGHGCDA